MHQSLSHQQLIKLFNLKEDNEINFAQKNLASINSRSIHFFKKNIFIKYR